MSWMIVAIIGIAGGVLVGVAWAMATPTLVLFRMVERVVDAVIKEQEAEKRG